MSLLDLPNEMIEAIAWRVYDFTLLNSLSRTNRRMYHLLNIYLYRHCRAFLLAWAA